MFTATEHQGLIKKTTGSSQGVANVKAISDHPTKEMVMDIVKKENVQFVNIQFTDLYGIIKAVAIPVCQLETVIDDNIWFDGSSIQGFTRICESDMYLKPDLSTFAVLPWTRDKKFVTARIIGDVYMPDEKPFEGDPRYILKRMLKKVQEIGYSYFVGPEFEFFLFGRDENGKVKFLPHDKGSYFDQTQDLASEVRHAMSHNLEEMGIEVESLHHEVAPGSHEISIKYSDALRMADNAMTLRWVVKETAAQFGLHATFMPKPVSGISGSGMHVHQSLFKNGDNAFYDENDEKYNISSVARQFMAGQMKHVREMGAVINPTVNSYKRLVSGYEAPVYIAWGAKNRSALIRIPRLTKGRTQSTRCEIRCPDPSTNPYLAFSAMLGAGLAGIKGEYELPEPIEDNVYQFTDDDLYKKGIRKLAQSLREAIIDFRKSELMSEVFGEHTFKRYLEAKKEEWNSYRMAVSQWEKDRYMEVY